MSEQELMQIYNGFERSNPPKGNERTIYSFKCFPDHTIGSTNLFVSGYHRARLFSKVVGVKPKRN